MAGAILSLLVLKTRNITNLKVFYRALGVELVEEQHGTGPVHYSGQVGGVVLEIYPLAGDGTFADPTTRLGFAVEKLDKVMEALQTLGTVVLTAPKPTEWGYRAVVRDPDGRAVELYQR